MKTDAENAEAYLGLLLTRERCRKLIEYSLKIQKRYASAVIVRKTAVEADTARLAAAVEKYTTDGCMTEDEVRSFFAGFDFSYDSIMDSSIENREKAKTYLNTEENLVNAWQYASGELEQSLKSAIADIRKHYDLDVARVKQAEEAVIAQKQRDYAAFLDDAERKAKAAFEQARAAQMTDAPDSEREPERENTETTLPEAPTSDFLPPEAAFSETELPEAPTSDFLPPETAFSETELPEAPLSDFTEQDKHEAGSSSAAEKKNPKKLRLTAAILGTIAVAIVAVIVLICTSLKGKDPEQTGKPSPTPGNTGSGVSTVEGTDPTPSATPEPTPEPVVNSITLNKSDFTLSSVGETYTIAATISPAGFDAKITWISEDPNVATVDENGKVTAVDRGKTIVSAVADGVTAECIVRVNADNPNPNHGTDTTQGETVAYVTINANGVLELEAQPIALTDGMTLEGVLKEAHRQFYSGGESGFVAGIDSTYNIYMISQCWGVATTPYVILNNAPLATGENFANITADHDAREGRRQHHHRCRPHLHGACRRPHRQ